MKLHDFICIMTDAWRTEDGGLTKAATDLRWLARSLDECLHECASGVVVKTRLIEEAWDGIEHASTVAERKLWTEYLARLYAMH